MIRSSIALIALVASAAAAPAAAQVFMYECEDGSVHFSDVPRHAGFRELQDPKEKARSEAVAQARHAGSHEVATRAWDGVIAKAGKQHGISPGLLKAIVHVESLFDLYAVSRTGAQGLMQLMPRTAEFVGVVDPFNPWQNIDGGTKYLVYLMGRFKGDQELALAAYNAGETTVRRYGGIPPYLETKNYVQRVMSLARRYDADFRR